jgi:protein-disulfide isomerase
VQAIKKQLGDELRFVYRHFPLTEAHPHAQSAAEAAEAAGAQGKFWQMHDTLFRNQAALYDEDLLLYAVRLGLDAERFARELVAGTYVKKVRDDFRGGVRSGVNGTPTFFVNGARFDGNWTDPAEFVQVLTEAAAAAHAGSGRR